MPDVVRRRLLIALVLLLALAPAATALGAAGENPFAGARLYVRPDSDAADQARAWASSRPADAAQLGKIAREGWAEWLGGWLPDAGTYVRWYIRTKLAPTGSLGFFVIYNLPHRDCSGAYSAGGAAHDAAYRAWIDDVANGIGNYPTAVVVEPDGLPDAGCLNQAQRHERYALEAYVTHRLASLPHTSVYIDAGRSDWRPWRQMVAALRASDVAEARGFALNVTGYATTAHEVAYGNRIARALGGKHFIVNTSRNGRGPWKPPTRSFQDRWCNQRGRALGPRPTTRTGSRFADAYEWILHPGYSDGPCNGGGPAGSWWPDYALELARNASY